MLGVNIVNRSNRLYGASLFGCTSYHGAYGIIGITLMYKYYSIDESDGNGTSGESRLMCSSTMRSYPSFPRPVSCA